MPTTKTSAAARKAQLATNLSTVALTAMREGQSLQAAIEAVRATIGKTQPSKELFDETRHVYQSGRMAFALYAGSNLSDLECIAKARVARDSAGADGKGNLKAGQRRRTKAEQAAYDASRQAWARLIRAAKIVTREPRGGKKPGKQTAPPKGPKRAAEPKTVTMPAAEAAKYVPPIGSDPDKAAAFVRQQAAMLLAYVEAANQRAMKASGNTLPIAICTAVADFKVAIDKAK